MFLLSINWNEKLHHMESSKEWPQTECLCLQMTQVLKFTAPSWMVVGGCVSGLITRCTQEPLHSLLLPRGILGEGTGYFTPGAHNNWCDNPSIGFCEERAHKRTRGHDSVRMPHGPVRRVQSCHAQEQPWGSAFCPP